MGEVRLQACVHIAAPAKDACARWLADPWFQRALRVRLGGLLSRRKPEEKTPLSSRAAGVRWVEWGSKVRVGFIPVSDGTDLVLEVREGWRAWMREKLSSRRSRQMGAFLRAAADRFDAPDAPQPQAFTPGRQRGVQPLNADL